MKLINRLNDLENSFICKYGDKKNYEHLNNYKFLRLLFELAPTLDISEGLPVSLLTDVWEIAYDIVANFDISNQKLIAEICDFFEHISTNNEKLFWYITYFLDEFESFDAEHIIFAKLQPNTKKLWFKFLKDNRSIS